MTTVQRKVKHSMLGSISFHSSRDAAWKQTIEVHADGKTKEVLAEDDNGQMASVGNVRIQKDSPES